MKAINNFLFEAASAVELSEEDANRGVLPEEENWAVVLYGGSVGEQEQRKFRVGGKRCSIVRENLPKEEAKADAKLSNKFLTPGEKKYYRLLYSAVLRSKIKEC